MTKLRPQVFTAIIALTVIALTTIILRPENLELVVGACVTGIGMLAMKVIEDRE